MNYELDLAIMVGIRDLYGRKYVLNDSKIIRSIRKDTHTRIPIVALLNKMENSFNVQK